MAAVALHSSRRRSGSWLAALSWVTVAATAIACGGEPLVDEGGVRVADAGLHANATNACGGSGNLVWHGEVSSARPGDACGPCSDGAILCASPNVIACVGASPAKACADAGELEPDAIAMHDGASPDDAPADAASEASDANADDASGSSDALSDGQAIADGPNETSTGDAAPDASVDANGSSSDAIDDGADSALASDGGTESDASGAAMDGGCGTMTDASDTVDADLDGSLMASDAGEGGTVADGDDSDGGADGASHEDATIHDDAGDASDSDGETDAPWS